MVDVKVWSAHRPYNILWPLPSHTKATGLQPSTAVCGCLCLFVRSFLVFFLSFFWFLSLCLSIQKAQFVSSLSFVLNLSRIHRWNGLGPLTTCIFTQLINCALVCAFGAFSVVCGSIRLKRRELWSQTVGSRRSFEVLALLFFLTHPSQPQSVPPQHNTNPRPNHDWNRIRSGHGPTSPKAQMQAQALTVH